MRACLRACVCVWVRFCTCAHQCVRACVHIHRGMSDLGPSIICFSRTTLLQTILSQSWAEKSKLLGRISSSELDPQPWHIKYDRFSFPSPHNNLGCNLYSPSNPTSHALPPPPTLVKETSSVVCALAPHRLATR